MREVSTASLDAVLVDRSDLLVFISAGTANSDGLRCRITVIMAPIGDVQLGDFFDVTEDTDEFRRGVIWASTDEGPLDVEVVGGGAVSGADFLRREIDIRLPWPPSLPLKMGLVWPVAQTNASATLLGDLASLRRRVSDQSDGFEGGE